MTGNPDPVRTACEANYEAHKRDCSGFAKTVSAQLRVPLMGLADDIVETLRTDEIWTPIADGVAAEAAAAAGVLVLAGLKGNEQEVPNLHGHIVVVVKGLPLAWDSYPFAYWGSLGGAPGCNETTNYAWTEDDRDNVSYASTPLT